MNQPANKKKDYVGSPDALPEALNDAFSEFSSESADEKTTARPVSGSDFHVKNYGVIGNLYSSALISPTGSVDWCCFPYLDSASHFGSLIHEKQGGHLHIFPQGEYRVSQSYLKGTQILETLFETPFGKGKVQHWMPIEQPVHRLGHVPRFCEQVQTLEGSLTWILHCDPRFRYGADEAQAEKIRGGVLFRNRRNQDLLTLHSSVTLEISSNGSRVTSQFTLNASEMALFQWCWGRESIIMDSQGLKLTGLGSEGSELNATREFWEQVAHRCTTSGTLSHAPNPTKSCIFGGPWHDMVVRSGLLSKLLVSPYSGAIAEAVAVTRKGAAPGIRIWGNRYASIRDSALVLQALVYLDYRHEAQLHFEWLKSILERDGAENLQSVYTLDGGRISPEREFHVFRGHEGIRQFQLDIFGHALLGVSTYFRIFRKLPPELWPRLSEIGDYVCQVWKRPDHGPWGLSTRPQHFLVSKLFCWKALEQLCWLAKETQKEIPPRWKSEQRILHQTLCAQGFDEKLNSFIGTFGSSEVDSSCLWIPLLGFLHPDDPRVQGTLHLIRTELAHGVLLEQDRGSEIETEKAPGDLWSSLIFIVCLSICGHPDEASDRLAELCTYSNSLGLFGDRVDSSQGESIQNFPSTTAHLLLINAALYIGVTRLRHRGDYHLLGLEKNSDLELSKTA